MTASLTVHNVYAVYTVYTIYTVCIVTLLPPHTVYTICTIWTALHCSNTSMNADISCYKVKELLDLRASEENGMEWMGQWIRNIVSVLTTWEPGVLKTSTCCYHCLMRDWCPLFVANIFRQGHFGHFVTSSSRFSKISRQVTVEALQNHVVGSSRLSSSWR